MGKFLFVFLQTFDCVPLAGNSKLFLKVGRHISPDIDCVHQGGKIKILFPAGNVNVYLPADCNYCCNSGIAERECWPAK